MEANRHLKTLRATVELQIEVEGILFKERCIVMTNVTSPLTGLLSLQRNSTILDMRQTALNLHFFHATQARRQHVLKR